MDKTYQPQYIEAHWNMHWEQQQYAKPSGSGTPYAMMLPPPNVTGSLHMGHGFQQTLMDALIRYQRMQGKNTLWQGGTDHAGIATQMLVERQLSQQGIQRHDLGREKFIAEIWKWRQHSGDSIFSQMKRLGASIDWENSRFTMDEVISEATQAAFLQLYQEGLIYRGKKLVNWDPQLHTAISDLEVETVESDGSLWHIRYPLAQQEGYLIVATTRPETLLGDSAVAVHPDDTRYQHLIGKSVQLPLCHREIPIIADECVDKAFGTGCVKITPAHDFNDHETGKRHQLPLINILTPEAHINENAPKAYQGLERYAARKKIIADLSAAGLLEKIEAHRMTLPKGDRSGVVIEPYLTDQWFVNASALAKPAIDAVKKGELRFVPQNWENTYLQWLENIEDWCISRQLWWGHRIPVWYDADGKAYAGNSEQAIRQQHKLPAELELQQDPDVLDTWFSASLWPFATQGWPQQTAALATHFPSHVLITGFDIIFFWVARMAMMGLKLTGKIPFKEVYITGLIRDSHGKKMSKSKGNVLDPIDLIDGISLEALIEKRTAHLMQPQMKKTIEQSTRKEFPNGIKAHGTDALRFTFCALATTGRDINFDMGRIDGYRNFCNKIWNAARYVLTNNEQSDSDNHQAVAFSIADQWITSILQSVIQKVHHYFEIYRFDLLAQTLYEFVWNSYCDWYLELSKCQLTSANTTADLMRGTRLTLLQVLETSLRLLHPIMPFISEEIWQKVAPLVDNTGPSIMVASFPTPQTTAINQHAEKAINWLKDIVVAIRTLRSETNISPAKPINLLLCKGTPQDRDDINTLSIYLKKLAKVDQIHWVEKIDELTATTLINNLEIHVPLSDVIDKEREKLRLQKEIDKLNKDISKYSSKLNNQHYLSKAPEAVVTQERQRLERALANLDKLSTQLNNL